MKYNFDEIIDRQNTNALNTDGFRGYIFGAGPEKTFPYADDEFIRMWVADMEFATPPEICQAMVDRISRRIFGYTKMFGEDYYNLFSKWCEKMYGWKFERDELVFSSGVVPAILDLVGNIVNKDENVIIMTPSYGPFKRACDFNGVGLVTSDLIIDCGDFRIDFEDLEKKAKDPSTKLIIWCNPHNPTGRKWSEEELSKVAKIVRENDLWIISDEIHCDLLRSGLKHIPMGKIMPDYDKLITCMSASKTFNVAGLMFSNIIIRNEELRKKYISQDKNSGSVNPLSLAAQFAAYEKCDEWLVELKEYLDSNFDILDKFLKENYPEIEYKVPEATYLAWINFGAVLKDVEDMSDFFANNAGVLLEGGNGLFVGNADGYIRLNLAMPKSMLTEGLERMKKAIDKEIGISK